MIKSNPVGDIGVIKRHYQCCSWI